MLKLSKYFCSNKVSYLISLTFQVPNDIKLPVLYLIDSIVKNVNGPYLKLFTQNIANTFCNVFEKVSLKKYFLHIAFEDILSAVKRSKSFVV